MSKSVSMYRVVSESEDGSEYVALSTDSLEEAKALDEGRTLNVQVWNGSEYVEMQST